MQKQMKCLVSCVTQEPKLRPTTQCHVGLYFLSNYFLMQAAMSFSMLNFSRATLAQSIASCCISSFMSACLITAFLSAVDITIQKQIQLSTKFQDFHLFIFHKLIQYPIKLSLERMSRFRASPSRSPFRSPPRLYQTERDAIIEDEIRLKSAIKAQSDIRRMNDDLALLQLKVRHTNELQDKVQSLVRQNSQLARDNDELARQLSERRYELQRLRAAAAEHHDREAIKAGQLFEVNKALQLEIQLLKKQRIEGNRLFEAHIQKLQRMLDQKVVELDSTTLKCSELSKQLELATIKFQEERNRLKNIMTRTQHELQRQLEYTKQKQTSQKFSEIDALKRNYSAQISLLQDEISKLKGLNSIKSQQFESQLNQNRNLRKRHDQEVRLLGAENDDLRARMLKLQQINRSQVENIQLKYNDYHAQGTSNLKEQHGRQIKLLLDQIDKQKWLISQKNIEIQNLVQEKRDLRRNLDETQLQLNSEIESLKNKLYSQRQKNAQDAHELMTRINQISNKLLSESQGYHQRVKQFRNKISRLENEINDKQNTIQKNKKQSASKQKQLKSQINNYIFSLQKVRRELSDSQYEKNELQKSYDQHKKRTQAQLKDLHAQLNQTQVKLENSEQKIKRQGQDHGDLQSVLKIQIDSLKKTIAVLEQNLSQQQARHAKQMQQYSANLNDKLKKLQSSQRKALDELELSKNQQIQVLTSRIEKLTKDKEYAESELKRYIQMYMDLQKYFKQPHDGALFQQKSKNSIYQVLGKVQTQTIHIF